MSLMGTETLETRLLAALREDPHRSVTDLAVKLGVRVIDVIEAQDRLVEQALALPDAD
jgi:hypothetical protein